MPTELAGHSIKEWSLIILLTSLGITFGIIGVAFAMAVIANPSAISFTGTFDVSQFVGILIGISAVAVVFVGQQLTARQVTNAIKDNDETWLKEK